MPAGSACFAFPPFSMRHFFAKLAVWSGLLLGAHGAWAGFNSVSPSTVAPGATVTIGYTPYPDYGLDNISGVTIDGTPITYSYSSQTMTLTVPTTISGGYHSVSVTYRESKTTCVRGRCSTSYTPYMTDSPLFSVVAPNQAPTAITASATPLTLNENVAAGTYVGSFSTTDPDVFQTFTYELAAGGSDNAAFTLSAAGSLTVNAAPDFETKSSYSIRVRTTDSGSPALSLEQTFTIMVTDLIELSGTSTGACTAGAGTATVAIAGVGTGYGYSWSPAPGGGQGTAGATSLSGGTTYTVTVSKAGLTSATRSFAIASDAAAAPTALARNPTVTLGPDGTATLTAADVDNGSTDNCGVTARTLSRSTFGCADKSSPANQYALKFDGTNDYVALPGGALNMATANGTGFTFEAWVNFAATPAGWTRIFDFGRDQSNYLFLAVNNASPSRLRVGIRNGGTEYTFDGTTSATLATALTGWHHYALTLSKSATGTVTGTLYLDGTAAGTSSSLGNLLPGSLASAGTPLPNVYLGKSQFSDPFANATFDEVRLWEVARPAADIAATKDVTLLGTEANLRAYYPGEASSGTALTDATGHGYDGILTSFNFAVGSNWLATPAPATASTTPVTLTVADAAGNQSMAVARLTVLQPSAASTPALTWTGTAGTSWSDCGNWSYGLLPGAGTTSISIPAGRPNYPTLAGTSLTVADLSIAAGASMSQGSTALLVTGNLTNAGAALTGAVTLTGPGTQTVAGSFSTLVVNKASGTATLSADATVTTALTLTAGILSTGSNTLTLGSVATLTESPTSYVTGTLQTTRPLSTAGANTFGNLGLTLAPAVGSIMPGSTLVKRITGTARTGLSGSQGILRSFDIQPTVNSGLNVTLTFSYRDAELNGIAEASLALFKSETGAADTWGRQRNVALSAAANTATLAGVRDFSVWTLGNANAPLPVELAAFTARAEGSAARLKWTTASEKNNAYFAVERSLDGREFSTIGRQPGQGSKASPTSYTFLDDKPVTSSARQATYYRLRQVDTDGTTSYSPVRTVQPTDQSASRFTVFPAPARAGQPLAVAGLPAGTAVQLLDALGRRIVTGTTDAAGTAQLALPNGLAAGVYVVRAAGQARQLPVVE